MEEVQEKVAREISEELSEKVSREITEELVAEAQEKTLREIGEDTSAEAIEKLYKKNLKELAEEVSEDAAAEVTEKLVKEQTEVLAETATERMAKQAIKTGGLVIGGVVAFNSFLNSDALDKYVESATGLDCDQKAEEAGLVAGTPEYEERVTECQEDAASSMAMLGKMAVGGGLLIGGLVVFSILSKIGLFSGSSSDEE
jgi:predicted NodU family carbamoyl transferase